MSRALVAAIAVFVLCGFAAGAQEESESVRINVKEDLIEISVSQDTWYLSHGQALVRVDRTDSMGPEELQAFLREHLDFELAVDGVPVPAASFEIGSWVNPVANLEVWIAAWNYDLDFTPGIHVLTGTWKVIALPCDHYVFGCDPNAVPTSPDASCDFTEVQPLTCANGLVSEIATHTLTLAVLP